MASRHSCLQVDCLYGLDYTRERCLEYSDVIR